VSNSTSNKAVLKINIMTEAAHHLKTNWYICIPTQFSTQTGKWLAHTITANFYIYQCDTVSHKTFLLLAYRNGSTFLRQMPTPYLFVPMGTNRGLATHPQIFFKVFMFVYPKSPVYLIISVASLMCLYLYCCNEWEELSFRHHSLTMTRHKMLKMALTDQYW